MDGVPHPAGDSFAGLTSAGEPDGVLELLDDFLDEAETSLVSIEPAVTRLERCSTDLAALSEAFRVMHTLKGTGGFLGLCRLAALAHATEGVLDRLRRDATGGGAAGPDTVGVIMVALDRLGALLRQTRGQRREPPGGDADVLAMLHAASASDTTCGVAPGVETPREARPAEVHAESSTLRVAVPVLEQLLASVGELVLARNELVLHAERISNARHDGDGKLGLLAQRIGTIATELQTAALRTRMQPVGQAWATLPRLVRDLSLSLGKRIVLETTGTETELDRQVLEQMRDPLSHMLRNSCDHGIETPEVRSAAGKPAAGRIVLDARQDGTSVVVTLRDDGRGIDLGRLRDRARADHILNEAELACATDEQLFALVFRPGLSTAATITAISGRGVGMDVVKSGIERLGGSVSVASETGVGTTLTLTLPLTLAILPVLMVATRGQRFALPRGAVGEIVTAPLDPPTAAADGVTVETIDGVALLRCRDELLPLVDLGGVLGLAPVAGQPAEALHIVVVRTGGVTFGLVVDPVFDTEEVVVTPLCGLLRGIPAFGGTTILGDGALSLVLDPAGLGRMAGIRPAFGLDAPTRQAALAFDAADAIPMLLFTASGQKMAVQLGLIARLEQVNGAALSASGDGAPATLAYTLRLGGRLLAARSFRAGAIGPADSVAALIIGDGDRRVALLVDGIEDVVSAPLQIEAIGVRPGVLGTALLGGAARSVLDVRHWLTRMDQSWFDQPAVPGDAAPRLLVVEDSDFFRQLLVPSLTAAGYAVTSTPSATEALRLRDEGVWFDAIVTDLEMPGMSGLDLVAAIRAAGAWAAIPVIALTARTGPGDIAAGRIAGFTDHIRKFERAALLAALERCLTVAA